MDFFQYLTIFNTAAVAIEATVAYFWIKSIINKKTSNENQIYRTTVVQNV